ncbi:hypothetical protein ABZ619_41020 [Streptomyces sp. NPDC007851]|uniref:hypothetical protein n=1 Tax=Streptomyces sp. NPDC007851 TaxID=3155008 RepID=UPI0033C15A3C
MKSSQAKAAGKFTSVHEAWWAAACKVRGDRDGTQALIDVLLPGRRLPHEHLVAGLAATLRVGPVTADAVAPETRKPRKQTPPPRPRPGRSRR